MKYPVCTQNDWMDDANLLASFSDQEGLNEQLLWYYVCFFAIFFSFYFISNFILFIVYLFFSYLLILFIHQSHFCTLWKISHTRVWLLIRFIRFVLFKLCKNILWYFHFICDIHIKYVCVCFSVLPPLLWRW